MKKIFLFLGAILLLFSLKLEAQIDNSISIIKAEATKNAQSFLTLIPEGMEQKYGFENRSDFAKVKVEAPFQTYYVFYESGLLSLKPSNEWRVPLSIDGRFVTLLTVQYNKGTAEVVDMGGAGLAQKIQEFEKQMRGEIPARIIIRNTFLAQDFLTLKLQDLLVENQSKEEFVIDKESSAIIYQLNAGKAIETTVSAFCLNTAVAIAIKESDL